jgi:hypothetical protein
MKCSIRTLRSPFQYYIPSNNMSSSKLGNISYTTLFKLHVRFGMAKGMAFHSSQIFSTFTYMSPTLP